MKTRRTKSDWYIPGDWLAHLGFHVMLVLAMCTALLGPWLASVRQGNPTPVYASLVLAAIGVILLFFARLPLYREKKFFTFGSRHLKGIHKKLYRLAYCFIGASIVIMLFLLAMLK